MNATRQDTPLLIALPSKGRLQENAFAFFGLVFEQGEDHFLLAQAARALDLVGNGHFHQFGNGQIFQVG